MPKTTKKTKQKVGPLKWTPMQVHIFELHNEGMGQTEIKEQTGAGISAVKKVIAAAKLGQTPAGKSPITNTKVASSGPAQVKQAVNQFKYQTSGAANGHNVNIQVEEDGVDEEQTETGGDSGTGQPIKTKTPKYKDKIKDNSSGVTPPPADITSLLKMVSVPVTCILTPIMINARMAAIRELNWREDMPWENFFDTCLYLLFKSWGIILQGYYRQEEIEAITGSPPPETEAEEDGGNGVSPDEMALITKFIKFVKEEAANAG